MYIGLSTKIETLGLWTFNITCGLLNDTPPPYMHVLILKFLDVLSYSYPRLFVLVQGEH